MKDGVRIYTYSINPEYWLTPGDITLGVYSHELGHVLGLPDLYDTDYSSRGVGRWSLMAGGSWNGTNGSSPAHFDVWSKIYLGFVAPTVPSYDQTGISLPRIETNASAYKLWTNGSPGNEYFLLENRQRTGYDTYLPSEGLLIWHIDDNESGNTDEWWPSSGLPGHYLVALEQADNLWELEQNIDYGDTGDPYPGSTVNRTFSAASSPNSNSYAGTGTQVSVVNISNSGVTMTADIAVGSPQSIRDDDITRPRNVRLRGNAPNPFNPETMISMEVDAETSVRLEVFNLKGQKIKLLIDEIMQPGYYNIGWDGKDNSLKNVGTGVYFCRMTGDGISETIKMLKIK